MPFNEYQPGALVFLSSMSLPLRLSHTLGFYEKSLKIINLALLLLIGIVIYSQAKASGLTLFSLILLVSGPIILFRFEALVILFTLLSLWQFEKQHWLAGWVWLTLGIATKVYPIFLVPLVLIATHKQAGTKATIKQATIWLLLLILSVGFFSLVFRQPLPQMLTSLSFHSQKPLHIESVWAIVPTLTYWVTHGRPPQHINQGIIGLPFSVISTSTINLLKLLSFVMLGALYVKILRQKKLLASRADNWVQVLLLVTVTSFILSPQYLLWWAYLWPLSRWRLTTPFAILVLTILALTQYVFPLSYTNLVDHFFAEGTSSFVYWVLTLRNVLLVVLLLSVMKEVFYLQKISTHKK